MHRPEKDIIGQKGTEQNRTVEKSREEKKWEEDKLLFYVVVLIKIVTNERWRKR